VGFVFQAFHLLPYLTVAGNVALPLALNGVGGEERERRVREALASVGLAGLEARRPGSLSGGEMQRAAIARALVHRPALVLADEPTGNLDEANAEAVLACLGEAVKRSGAAALMVTHSALAAARADQVLRLARGRLERA
jgi:putative ABC transport system ATP-binding protein